jgi:hypothetical protein
MKDKLLHQIEAVIAGEASLLELAHSLNINYERVEEQIRKGLSEKKIFGYDDIMDIVFVGYCVGRRDGVFASIQNIVGQEELQKLYGQVCLKLGISPRTLQ